MSIQPSYQVRVINPSGYRMSIIPACWYCDDRVETVKKCANCLTAIYCDPRCQRDDWKNRHKIECVQIQEDKRKREERAAIATARLAQIGSVPEIKVSNFNLQPAEFKRLLLDTFRAELMTNIEATCDDFYDEQFARLDKTVDFIIDDPIRHFPKPQSAERSDS